MNAISIEDPFGHAALEAEVGETEAGYTRSNGVWTPLRLLATPHLKSAHAKLAREWPGHPEIAPMAEEIAKRDAAFHSEQAALAGPVSQ
jgi:hypothetical protein